MTSNEDNTSGQQPSYNDPWSQPNPYGSEAYPPSDSPQPPYPQPDQQQPQYPQPGYPQPGYQQPQYAQPQYPYGAAPPQYGYGYPGQQPYGYGAPYVPYSPEADGVRTHAIIALVISVVMLLSCYVTLGGLAGTILSGIALNTVRTDINRARSLLKWTWISIGINIALIVLGIIVLVILGVNGAFD